MSTLRNFHSEGALTSIVDLPKLKTKQKELFPAQSEPSLHQKHDQQTSNSSIHFDDTPLSCIDLIHASNLLEEIVSDVSIVKSLSRSNKKQQSYFDNNFMVNDRILRIVYDTMKFLPFIDTILIKTQFLVYYPQFLNQLPLLKIMLYDFMKSHFDVKHYPGILFDQEIEIKKRMNQKVEGDDDDTDEEEDDDGKDQTFGSSSSEIRYAMQVVKELNQTLVSFRVKLAAALARIRIDRGASGNSLPEMVSNILSEDLRKKEMTADVMKKYFRIRNKEIQTQIEELLIEWNPTEDEFEFDEQFDNLLTVSSRISSNLQETELYKNHHIVLQDKTYFYTQKYVEQLIGKDITELVHINPGCGTMLLHILDSLGAKRHVHVFETRTGKLDSLKSKLDGFKHSSKVTIHQRDFKDTKKEEKAMKNSKFVLFTPTNSGSGMVDKLSYFIQEKEYPMENLSQNEKLQFKLQNRSMLHHAMTFPNVDYIVYMTHSIYKEENQDVIQETLDKYGDHEWVLDCVLADLPISVPMDIHNNSPQEDGEDQISQQDYDDIQDQEGALAVKEISIDDEIDQEDIESGVSTESRKMNIDMVESPKGNNESKKTDVQDEKLKLEQENSRILQREIMEECFQILPSNEENGLFLACLRRKSTLPFFTTGSSDAELYGLSGKWKTNSQNDVHSNQHSQGDQHHPDGVNVSSSSLHGEQFSVDSSDTLIEDAHHKYRRRLRKLDSLSASMMKDVSFLSLQESRHPRMSDPSSGLNLNANVSLKNPKFKLVKDQRQAVSRLSQPKRTFTEEDMKRKQQEREAKALSMLQDNQHLLLKQGLHLSSSTSKTRLDQHLHHSRLGPSMFSLNDLRKEQKIAAFIALARQKFGLKRFYAPMSVAMRKRGRRKRRDDQKDGYQILHPRPWK